MKNLLKFLLGTVKGVAETTLIPSVIREVKKVTNSGAKKWLDTNGDGKITLADIEALKWETVGKLLAVGAVLYLFAKYGVTI